jgi:hypothetical protein
MAVELRNKVKELLQPHDIGHPITSNHDLTENVQRAQGNRRAREIRESLEKVLGADYAASGVVTIDININTIINALVAKTEADMNSYASSTATDFMEAYYKVSVVHLPKDWILKEDRWP